MMEFGNIVAENRHNLILSCNRRANLALCMAVLRRNWARHDDWAQGRQHCGRFETNELTTLGDIYEIFDDT